MLEGFSIYMNHSCDPNIGIFDTKNVRNYFALKEIEKDEQLFYDYSTQENIIENFEENICYCGTKLCRGHVRGWK